MILVGVGGIGARTAKLAQAFGMRVLGVRKNPDLDVPGVAKMYSAENLLEILPEGDFVVLTVPLTAETRGMFADTELQAMKESAYIINIGRGGIIDEGCLVNALEQGWIAGAGLDVFEEEPLPADSPLWKMENVIITSHYSGMTPHYHQRGLTIFKDNLKRYVAGEELRNVVDKEVGY
jgi:phosphoglycerate dehydrogenase-like enzyme